jgi:DMSO/TMAO reductase YedYZ molybdopterin-dependent catalytic subunit
MHFVSRSGLLIGFLLSVILASVLFMLHSVLGTPFIPFDIFDGLVRLLPGSVITAGLENMVRVLQFLGLSLRESSKVAEQVQAVVLFLVAGTIVGSIAFKILARRSVRSILKHGIAVGVATTLPVSLLIFFTSVSESRPFLTAIWILLSFTIWGFALSWAHQRIAGDAGRAKPHAETAVRASSVEPIDRRRFVIKLAGASAIVTVAGVTVSRIVKATTGFEERVSAASEIDMPTRSDAVQPAPGTRPEYTPVEDHYRVDITLRTPQIEANNWHLPITGLVEHPLQLTLEEIRGFSTELKLLVTLSCISNPLGGDLIGTTQWSGVSVQQILSRAGVRPEARFLKITSQDGFYETVPLELVRSDERIMFTYAWDSKPLTPEHGFPLRIYIPDRYGMKQPKWITGAELISEYTPGYWVERGWDETAQMKATSVIDTVAVESRLESNGQMLIPIGGIAHAGTRGISRVEVRVDDEVWQPAQLRTPLSNLTWVIWRYDWPFRPGDHTFQVRCYDGQERMQIPEKHSPHPSGATGIFSIRRTV